MSNETLKETTLVGAWTPFSSTIDNQAQSAFDEALKGLVGVDYIPVAVAQQVVAGMNYKFFCNTKLIIPFPINGSAMVSIYKPIDGKAHITGIQNID
ncbi:MAG: hypothetical protein JKY09_04300 [Crocinitomicaceae bacterium]|nr:hypothetical protein [Crocinitomicaceae bacterium]